MSNNYIVKGERTKTRTLNEAVEILRKHDEILPNVDYDAACEVIAAVFCVSLTDLKKSVTTHS